MPSLAKVRQSNSLLEKEKPGLVAIFGMPPRALTIEADLLTTDSRCDKRNWRGNLQGVCTAFKKPKGLSCGP